MFRAARRTAIEIQACWECLRSEEQPRRHFGSKQLVRPRTLLRTQYDEVSSVYGNDFDIVIRSQSDRDVTRFSHTFEEVEV